MNEKDWIELFKRTGILNRIEINKIEYHHISLPTKVVFTNKCINSLSKKYKPNEEIGGFLICEPKKNSLGIFLYFNEVHLMPNYSTKPWNSYSPYKSEEQRKEYENTLHSYLQQGLLPYRFHSHPVVANDCVLEKMRFLEQIDTSERDQVTTLIYKNVEQIKLRLPDILIVKEGGSMFVGLYGGLVCPYKFDDQKRKVISNVTENISNTITEWADTHGKQIGLAVGTLALIFLAVKYPKISIPVAVTGTAILPLVIYEHQKKPEYFAITTGQQILIELPLITMNEMLLNDKKLQEIKIKLDKNS